MRIFFIHGLGETPGIFEHIAPAIAGDQIFINLREELGDQRQDTLSVQPFAKTLVQKFSITTGDWIIGHSLGGWIAAYIKQETACSIVQISSWTSFEKVISPVRSGKIIYWLVRHKFYLNRIQRWLDCKKYRNLASAQIFREAFNNLLFGGREAAINQLRLIFEPAPALSIEPELRIHTRVDPIIRYPAEAFHEVPGDHFALFTHPKAIAEPIAALIHKKNSERLG